MAEPARVLRADDPEAARLLDAGWVVVAESWGARLRLGEPPDLDPWRALVEAARGRGYAVRELGPGELPAVAALEAVTVGDYPLTPATDVPERTLARLQGLDGRFFGVLAGDLLVAATAVVVGEERVETDFTSVHPEHRRRGLAVAVKAASVVAAAEAGARVFATGGAALNAGSLAMNARVGYVVEERWWSLAAES